MNTFLDNILVIFIAYMLYRVPLDLVPVKCNCFRGLSKSIYNNYAKQK